MEDRLLELLKEKPVDPVQVAAALGISGKATVKLVCRMAARGELRITEIRQNI